MNKRKYFTIHENDAGTEAYQDHYVHDLEEQVKRQQVKIERLQADIKEREEAARFIYRAFLEDGFLELSQAKQRWPWLEVTND